jgi:hypothetical protein
MRLPDDFFSVNEDEPGVGGMILALLVFLLTLFAVFGAAILAAQS